MPGSVVGGRSQRSRTRKGGMPDLPGPDHDGSDRRREYRRQPPTGGFPAGDRRAGCRDHRAPRGGGGGACGSGVRGRRGDVGAENALAVVRRLARTQQLPAELIAVLDGPLADAVAVAANYAGDAITATTRAAYLADWAEFAARCRAQQVDPTALPIHRVLVAAYLATLAGKIGRSALRRRVAAIVYHHRRRGLVWSSQQVAIRETRPMQGGSAPSEPRQHRARSDGRLYGQGSFRQGQPVNRLQRQRRTPHPLPRRDCSTRIPRTNCLSHLSQRRMQPARLVLF
jgi:hypothetical protein